MTRFWWDSNDGKKKINWISWDKMTLPKGSGGLGLKDIQRFNTALLAKIPWRILTQPNCLLARVLLGKYCHNASILRVEPNKSISHGWRGILAGRDLLVEHLGRVIGNGETNRIWGEPWISSEAPIYPHSPLQEDMSDLAVSDLMLRGSGVWNITKIIALLPDLVKEIMAIKPRETGAPDSYVWYPTASGTYSARSGYAAASESNPNKPVLPIATASLNWNKMIWNVKCPPKQKLLIWKILHNAIPTGDNLQRRGVPHIANCPHCGEYESIDHLFLHCPFATQIWDLAPIKTRFDSASCTGFVTTLEVSSLWTCLPPTGVTGDIFFWITWTIWMARNQRIFESRSSTLMDVISIALSNAQEWTRAQGDLSSTQVTPTSIPQSPVISIPPDTIVCNTDAAWNPITKAAGLGWIFTAQDSQLQQGSESHTWIQSSLQA